MRRMDALILFYGILVNSINYLIGVPQMITSLRRNLFIVLILFIVPHTCCISFASLKAFFNKQAIVQNDKIGIIKLFGNINEENTEKILKKIEAFGQDKNIKGVLLLINSTGGSAAASELLFREIKELKKVKPVVSFAIISCESGAYEVASASNWVIALATSSVGAIGVVQTIERNKDTRIKKTDYETNAEYELIQAGKYKTMYHRTATDLTQEQREWAQLRVDQDYKLFCKTISEQRNLSIDQTHEWADGKYFNGDTALQLGLIDQIGGYSDAIQKLREMVEAKGIKLKEKLTFVE